MWRAREYTRAEKINTEFAEAVAVPIGADGIEACGQQNLGDCAKVLLAAGFDTVSTDRYGYGFGESGVDFLAAQTPRARHRHQPALWFRLGRRFPLKALALMRQTGGKLALLLNLASLAIPAAPRSGSVFRRRAFTRSTAWCAGRRIATALPPRRSRVIAIVGSCGTRSTRARRNSHGCPPGFPSLNCPSRAFDLVTPPPVFPPRVRALRSLRDATFTPSRKARKPPNSTEAVARKRADGLANLSGDKRR